MMRPVSARFLSTLTGSHEMVAEARVVTPGQAGVDPAGTTIAVLDGDVRMNASAQVRSTLELTTDGTGMWPTAAGDLLAPYGNEIFARRGIRFGTGGTTEWVSLGYHRIDTVEQDRAPGGPIRITASDRMAGIVDGRLTAPRQYGKTATYGQMVSDLVGEVYPWATIEWDDTTDSRQLGRAIVVEQDRYAALDDLITGVGKIWWWDHRGVLVIRDLPDPGSPVWEVSHGEGGVLVSLRRRLSRERVYNAVVASGQGADTATPVRAVAYDADPASPTYWRGGFGEVPRFYSSPLITDVGQAQSAASSLLRKQLGLPYAVDLSAVPNPALEPHDPVRVTYPGRMEVHVLDRLTVPLTASGVWQASTREQTTVLVGVG